MSSMCLQRGPPSKSTGNNRLPRIPHLSIYFERCFQLNYSKISRMTSLDNEIICCRKCARLPGKTFGITQDNFAVIDRFSSGCAPSSFLPDLYNSSIDRISHIHACHPRCLEELHPTVIRQPLHFALRILTLIALFCS
jgi:hypothetical protein